VSPVKQGETGGTTLVKLLRGVSVRPAVVSTALAAVKTSELLAVAAVPVLAVRLRAVLLLLTMGGRLCLLKRRLVSHFCLTGHSLTVHPLTVHALTVHHASVNSDADTYVQ
jgi:hypothetical protein